MRERRRRYSAEANKQRKTLILFSHSSDAVFPLPLTANRGGLIAKHLCDNTACSQANLPSGRGVNHRLVHTRR